MRKNKKKILEIMSSTTHTVYQARTVLQPSLH